MSKKKSKKTKMTLELEYKLAKLQKLRTLIKTGHKYDMGETVIEQIKKLEEELENDNPDA